jgi:hypothetical protein
VARPTSTTRTLFPRLLAEEEDLTRHLATEKLTFLPHHTSGYLREWPSGVPPHGGRAFAATHERLGASANSRKAPSVSLNRCAAPSGFHNHNEPASDT